MEFNDYLTVQCREAGHEDKDFIEAARFGAAALLKRLRSDLPDSEEKLFDHSSYCSIWRNPEERPKDNSWIVLRNQATIKYALYECNMCYDEYGASFPMKSFNGQWCYKADMFGISKAAVYYDEFNK